MKNSGAAVFVDENAECSGGGRHRKANVNDEADALGEQEPVVSRRGITFAELREGRCTFPLGTINDPPEWFCGEPAPVGKVYCERCQARAYNRQERRR
jgi:hypothetical protein